jgi:Fibronectin type III domain
LGPVTGFASSSVTGTSVTLVWDPLSFDTSMVAGLRLTRNGVLVTTLPVTTTSFNNTGLVANTRYVYTIACVDSWGSVSVPTLLFTLTNRR